MEFNVQGNAVFIHEFLKIALPWEGVFPLPPPPPPPLPLPRFGPSLTNPGLHTVTGIAKCTMANAPAPLVDKSFKRGSTGIGIRHLTITYPLIIGFNVQENVVFIHRFSKISLPWRGKPPSHTFPPLGRFVPSLWP